MKKIILIVLVIFAVGCKSKEKVVGTKLDRSTEIAIKGNWVLSSVNYGGSDYIKVTSFNVADSKCFEGSEWSFVANNNKGQMALNSANCTNYSSNITWYINKDENMVLKFLTEGVKAKHTNSGYILRVVSQSKTQFQLIDKIDVAGKMTDVVYQFDKR
ncbi:lipocalin family protein [Flavobacterium ardleyense]|uniref:Lipocalin family protein n=1 Tax=Flavobacterium ardleyense TaxID=2038737 RepID=A0ABW5ZA32_9FLAO